MAEDAILEGVLQRDAMQEGGGDLAEYIGQIYYLVKDDLVSRMLWVDPDTRPLLFSLSHLVRTSKMDKKSRRIAKLHWEIACRVQLLMQKKPTKNQLAKYNSILPFGYAAIDDTEGGWRGLLVTEKVKTYKINADQKRRSGFLGLLGR